MKKIMSVLLICCMILGNLMPSNSQAVDTTGQTAVQKDQTIVVKGLKTKEGKWDRVTFSIKELLQNGSKDTKNNVFYVKMTVDLETFKGAKSATVMNNFPIKSIGDQKSIVNYMAENIENPMLGAKGTAKTDGKYHGTFATKKAVDLKKNQQAVGEFQITAPKTEKTIVFPVTLSDGKKIYFKIPAATLTDISVDLLSEIKRYGTADIGIFETQLNLLEEGMSASENETRRGNHYVLNRNNTIESGYVSISVYYDLYSESIHSQSLESMARREANDSQLDFKVLGKGIYIAEGYPRPTAFKGMMVIDGGNFYRVVEYTSSIKYKEALQALVSSLKFSE